MYTILVSIACLFAAWLALRLAARRKPARDAAALHAQFDQLLASFDANQQAFEIEDRNLRRQIRQATKRKSQSNAPQNHTSQNHAPQSIIPRTNPPQSTTPDANANEIANNPIGTKNLSPAAQTDSRRRKQLAEPKPRKPKPITSPSPADHPPANSSPTQTQTSTTSSAVNCPLSLANLAPLPPPPKQRIWPIEFLSACKNAAITAILRPIQVAVRSFFSFFTRQKPSAPPPSPIEHLRAAAFLQDAA